MKILLIISILLLIAGIGQSDDLLFFADDHYKSLGQPSLVATVVNPALLPGECVLEIDLANTGRAAGADSHQPERLRGGHSAGDE